jgi:hypothetical protein
MEFVGVLILLFVAFMAGGFSRGNTVYPVEVESAVTLCESNGGWSRSEYKLVNYTISCNNGAEFKLPRRAKEG